MLRRWLFGSMFLAFSSLLLFAGGGCAWFEELKGPGFPGWENGGTFRGKDPDARPSGYFFDRRSDQIEKSLGGNF